MYWFTELAQSLDLSKPHIVNDSKTPSGRVHVGALRGVLIHDAVFRVLKGRGADIRYLYGVDDYDPVDEIPKGQDEHFTQHLGKPLCNTPAPPGSTAPDMATHFISELFDVFTELGVAPEIYRMRDIYRSGGFNDAIDRILSHAADVRRIYQEVSGSVRPDNWHPFQVVCENCGRIGTTEVTAYEGGLVQYKCRKDLVKWAKGCENEGRVSPFDGRGKLPWKLEWTAKWHTFGVTIEGAGKDHTTKGGARDVSGKCFEAIFGNAPPRNIPYEFFLVGGAKMSSSKGVGASARQMADLLAPEVLRFLMLRTQPKSPVDFRVDEDYMVKLHNELDRLKGRVFSDPKIRDEERELYELCEVTKDGDVYDASFQLVAALVQLPHLDAAAELRKRAPRALSAREEERLLRRIKTAQIWLESYAEEVDKMRVHESLPKGAAELTPAQRGFLRLLGPALESAEWNDDALQAVLFDVARITPIDNASAFQAIYRVILDRLQGPRAGSFLAFLDRSFVIKRFSEVAYDEEAFLRGTASTPTEISAWLDKERKKIEAFAMSTTRSSGATTVLELDVTIAGKLGRKRVLLDGEEPDALWRTLSERYGSTT